MVRRQIQASGRKHLQIVPDPKYAARNRAGDEAQFEAGYTIAKRLITGGVGGFVVFALIALVIRHNDKRIAVQQLAVRS